MVQVYSRPPSACAIILLHPSSARRHDSSASAPVSSVLEGVMKKLLVLAPFLSIATGCMYPAQSLSGRYAGQRPMYPRAVGPPFNLAPLPLGRWDNVLMRAGRPPP